MSRLKSTGKLSPVPTGFGLNAGDLYVLATTCCNAMSRGAEQAHQPAPGTNTGLGRMGLNPQEQDLLAAVPCQAEHTAALCTQLRLQKGSLETQRYWAHCFAVQQFTSPSVMLCSPEAPFALQGGASSCPSLFIYFFPFSAVIPPFPEGLQNYPGGRNSAPSLSSFPDITEKLSCNKATCKKRSSLCQVLSSLKGFPGLPMDKIAGSS